MKMLGYLFTVFMFLGISLDVEASTYNVGQYVYYDPYNHKSCDINDYWTIYNQESTCYRWVIISSDIEEQSYDAVRLLLDHDIGVSNFSDRTKVFNDIKQKWNDPNILKMVTLGNNMVLSLYKGNYEKNNEWNKEKPTSTHYLTKKRSRSLLFTYTNTLFYYNGKKYYDYGYNTKDHKGGFWISHSDTNNDPFLNPETISNSKLAYYVTSNGHIQLSSPDDKRGVRPTIYIKESALKKASYKSEEIKLEKIMANGEESNLKINYKQNDTHQHSFSLNSNYYFYPQGFSFYNENSFLVYMAHRTKTENGVKYDDNSPGVLLQYKDQKFNHIGDYDFGHGNDISFTATNNFYISVDKNANILKFGLSNKNTEEIVDSKGKFYYGAFTFDSNGKYLYGLDSNSRVVIRDVENKYKIMYTFDAPILETLQSLTYNNGYLYITTYEVPKKNNNTSCNTDYQLYCYGDNRLTTVYVYNVKFDLNGKPSKFFGKLVKKYITNNINENNAGFSYEIESIGSIGNNLFLGYARKNSKNYVVPVAYKYPQNHKVLTYKKGEQNIKDNIIEGTYIDLQNSFKYNSNEDFIGWKNDQGTIVNNSIIKMDKNINLTSIYTEFEKGTIIDKNILKTTLNKEVNKFNSKNLCHNCNFKISSTNKYIGTGDNVGIYVDNKKLKEYEVIIKGDVTGTGTATIGDVTKLFRYVKKTISLNESHKAAGDVTGDGKTNIGDVTKLYRFIKGKISSLE